MKNAGALQIVIIIAIVIGLLTGVYMIAGCTIFKEKTDIYCSTGMKNQVKDLWDQLPVFRDSMEKVATLHVPYKKTLIESALSNPDFKVQTMANAGRYHFRLD